MTKSAIAPIELYEWGISAEGKAFERYIWDENVFFEDYSYCKIITREDLLEQIGQCIFFFYETEIL